MTALPELKSAHLRYALHRPALLAALSLTALFSACGPSAPPPAAPVAPPPAQVGVVTVAPADVGLVNELPGRLEASRVAQVRARAAGIVQKRAFKEGSAVKAGQLLFQIDPAPYAAALQTAQATLARAEANLTQAAALSSRYKPLVAANAVSKQDYASAVAAQMQAMADVEAGKAAVMNARINLDYASVTSPISGRIGRALVTEGALVGQGEATPLALVQQTNPMYVNFTQSATEAMALRRAIEAGQLAKGGKDAASVTIVLEDNTVYAHAGKLLFTDLTVDASSGQVTLRAQVPNPEGQLLPGLYVRVRLSQAKAEKAIALPQQAVTRSPQGDTVMVVDDAGKVSPRPVKLGGQQAGQWIVLSGLQEGEQVMVDGFQKLRGDAPVKAIPWQAPGSAAPAATATPAR